MDIGGTFVAGGAWMYPITIWGIITIALVVVQLKRTRTADLFPLLYGCMGAMIMSGLLGTLLGVTQAWTSLAVKTAGEELLAKLSYSCGIALITTEYALILAIPLTFLIGFCRHRRRKWAQPK